MTKQFFYFFLGNTSKRVWRQYPGIAYSRLFCVPPCPIKQIADFLNTG